MNVALGSRAKDRITGYEGIVVARTEWLNGCRRITLQAEGLKDGKPIDSYCCDVQQIQVLAQPDTAAPAPSGGPMPSPSMPSSE